MWLFLLGGALSLSNAIFIMKRRNNIDESMSGIEEEQDISLFSLIRECFGNTAGFLGGLLFLLLIKVTLIAQLSKIGVLLEGSFSIFNRQVWTSIFSICIGMICLVVKQQKIERINDILTATMLGSFASLVILTGGSGWSVEGLRRADFSSLLPGSSSKSWAIPVFIQLLIYNEVIPLVASRLGDETKVRNAIVLGSLVPLLMCLIWSCVALGLVPYDLSSISKGVIYDPLTNLGDAILSKGTGRLFLASINILAGSAICTTVIGSILASTQYFDDIITNFIGWRRSSKRKAGIVDADTNATIDNSARDNNMYRRVITHAIAILPSALVALYGSSNVYYRATSFAGEFPCTLLYGLIPPLCNMQLRWKRKQKGIDIDGKTTSSRWTDWTAMSMQMALAAISVAILILSNISSKLID